MLALSSGSPGSATARSAIDHRTISFPAGRPFAPPVRTRRHLHGNRDVPQADRPGLPRRPHCGNRKPTQSQPPPADPEQEATIRPAGSPRWALRVPATSGKGSRICTMNGGPGDLPDFFGPRISGKLALCRKGRVTRCERARFTDEQMVAILRNLPIERQY